MRIFIYLVKGKVKVIKNGSSSISGSSVQLKYSCSKLSAFEGLYNMYNEIIKGFMDEKGLSQAEVGEILGVNQTTVGKWLNGKKKPSYDSIYLIYEKFGVTPNELFGIE